MGRDRTRALCQEGFGLDLRDLGWISGKSSSPRGWWGTGTASQGTSTFPRAPGAARAGIWGCLVQGQELGVIPGDLVLFHERFWKSLCCCAQLEFGGTGVVSGLSLHVFRAGMPPKHRVPGEFLGIPACPGREFSGCRQGLHCCDRRCRCPHSSRDF